MSNQRRPLIAAALVFGILLIALAIFYFIEPAQALPSFLPGHEAGSGHHHVKHGIAAFVVGVGCFIFAWFASGPAAKQANR